MLPPYASADASCDVLFEPSTSAEDELKPEFDNENWFVSASADCVLLFVASFELSTDASSSP
jgi:hypothetical protein